MNRRLRIVAPLVFAAACGGPQPTQPDAPATATPTAPTQPAEPVVTEPAGPTPEELAAANLDAAENALLEAARLHGEDPEGNARRVQNLLQEAMERNPEFTANAWFNIGVSRYASGDEAGALAAYSEATSADPMFASGLANTGYIQMTRGDYDAAVATFNQCIERLETEPGCNINLAVLYAMGRAPYEGDLTSAMIERYRFALGGDAHNADAYGNLARIYYEQGQYDLARMTCENAILLGIDEAILHNRLGLIALQAGEVRDAYLEFQEAVELDEDFFEAWVNIGAMALSFRDYEAAVAAFERVLSDTPDDLDVKLSYGAALVGAGRPDEGRAEYEAVLSEAPGSPGALFNMALLHHETYNEYPTACGYYIQYLDAARPSDEEYGEAERRLFSLHSLMESLVFMEEATQADVDACTR